MRTRNALVLALVGTAAVVLVPAPSRADTLGAGSNSSGVVTQVGKGVKELGLETQLVFSSSSTPESAAGKGDDTKSSRTFLIGGAFFRYFVADDLDINVRAGGFFDSASAGNSKATTTASSLGFLGTVGADYLASLGGGMFVVPGLGIGGFAGNQETKIPSSTGGADTTVRFSRSGLALRAGLGLVFYASHHFNLFARPEAVILIGSKKLQDVPTGTTAPDPQKFTDIQAGFTCGFSYVF